MCVRALETRRVWEWVQVRDYCVMVHVMHDSDSLTVCRHVSSENREREKILSAPHRSALAVTAPHAHSPRLVIRIRNIAINVEIKERRKERRTAWRAGLPLSV